MDKVTGQCPQTTTFLKEKGEPKRVSNRGPSAYQPNALPLGQTGSQWTAVGIVSPSSPTSGISVPASTRLGATRGGLRSVKQTAVTITGQTGLMSAGGLVSGPVLRHAVKP